MIKLFNTLSIIIMLCLSLSAQASTLVLPPQNQNPFANKGRPLPQPTGPKLPAGIMAQGAKPGIRTPAQTAKEACQKDEIKSPVLVLSIDGAAVRGIAQFELLIALEDKVNEILAKKGLEEYNALPAAQRKGPYTYKRLNITEIFDFFAGTSAGSVNVGAILIPKDYTLSNTVGHVNEPKFSLTELKQKLPETLKAAFSSSLFRDIRTLQIPKVGGLLGTKFTATPFEEKLKEYGGKARISDLVKPAVITSYDLRAREIMNFSTEDACSINPGEDTTRFQKPDDKDFYYKDINVYGWQAIRASSAAPVFYKPLELEIGRKQRALIDAGLFVMSPTLLAWVEAQKIYRNRPLTIISISSGTLNEAREVQATGATAGSIPKVLQPTIETALEGQQALTDLMMRSIPKVEYHRLSFEVKNKEFDDTSPENIKRLEEAAQVTIKSIGFTLAINAIVKAIEARKKQMATNPQDFAPYVCQAKQKFRERLGLTPVSGAKNIQAAQEKSAKEDAAKQKMQDAFETIKVSGKHKCFSVLAKRDTESSEWKNGNCDGLLSPKEICSRMLEQSAYTSTQWNTNCRKKLIKPKSCKEFENQMKWDTKEFSKRNCQSVVNQGN